MKTFLSLFSFGKSKRRRTRGKKQKKRHTRRRIIMKGGWGEAVNTMTGGMKGVMKGGWGGPVLPSV